MMNSIDAHLLLCSAEMRRIHQALRAVQQTSDPRVALYENVGGLDSFSRYQSNFCLMASPNSPLSNYYGVKWVSICIPADAMGNRVTDGVSQNNPPSTIEVAMVNSDRELCYSHPLVSDVVRFESVDDLLDFLEELATYTAD
jgi:hypothetical protein